MSFIQLKDAEPEQIVAEALDMNELQQEIYMALVDAELTVQDLVEETGRTRSVVQRGVQALLEKGVIEREARTDRTVYYVYTAQPFDRVASAVSNIIDDWQESVLETLQDV